MPMKAHKTICVRMHILIFFVLSYGHSNHNAKLHVGQEFQSDCENGSLLQSLPHENGEG